LIWSIPISVNIFESFVICGSQVLCLWIGTERVFESLVIWGSTPTTMYEFLFVLANWCELSLMDIFFIYIAVVICMNFYLAGPTDVSTDLNYLLSHCRFEILSFWRKERASAKFRDSILVSSCGSSCLLVQYLHILPTPMKHMVFDWVWQVATASCSACLLARFMEKLILEYFSTFS
jgi:hypothetical protein